MTLVVHQHLLEQTRSSGKSCKWIAEATVNGKTYTATSRMAPANDIARQLVADGVTDAPMHVYTDGLKGCLVWRSFHRAAGFSCEESSTVPVRMKAWQDPAALRARLVGTFRDKRGVKAPAATLVAPDASHA